MLFDLELNLTLPIDSHEGLNVALNTISVKLRRHFFVAGLSQNRQIYLI